jgi:hypothetical protein
MAGPRHRKPRCTGLAALTSYLACIPWRASITSVTTHRFARRLSACRDFAPMVAPFVDRRRHFARRRWESNIGLRTNIILV